MLSDVKIQMWLIQMLLMHRVCFVGFKIISFLSAVSHVINAFIRDECRSHNLSVVRQHNLQEMNCEVWFLFVCLFYN
jgi:hypothetical protein